MWQEIACSPKRRPILNSGVDNWCTENKIKYTLAVLIDKTGANIIISFENLKDMVLFKLRWL
jgi:stringent starvation protein B